MKCDRNEQDDRSTHVWPPWKLANPVYKSQIKVVTKAGATSMQKPKQHQE